MAGSQAKNVVVGMALMPRREMAGRRQAVDRIAPSDQKIDRGPAGLARRLDINRANPSGFDQAGGPAQRLLLVAFHVELPKIQRFQAMTVELGFQRGDDDGFARDGADLVPGPVTIGVAIGRESRPAGGGAQADGLDRDLREAVGGDAFREPRAGG